MNASLAIVVDAHGKRNIFDRRQDDQRPDDERQSSEYDGSIRFPAGESKDRFQGVERTRSDIAENHTQRGEAQGSKA